MLVVDNSFIWAYRGDVNCATKTMKQLSITIYFQRLIDFSIGVYNFPIHLRLVGDNLSVSGHLIMIKVYWKKTSTLYRN